MRFTNTTPPIFETIEIPEPSKDLPLMKANVIAIMPSEKKVFRGARLDDFHARQFLPIEVKQRLDKIAEIPAYEERIKKNERWLSEFAEWNTSQIESVMRHAQERKEAFEYETEAYKSLIEQLKNLDTSETVAQTKTKLLDELEKLHRMQCVDSATFRKIGSTFAASACLVLLSEIATSSEVEVLDGTNPKQRAKVQVPQIILPRMKLTMRESHVDICARDAANHEMLFPFLNYRLNSTPQKLCLGEGSGAYIDCMRRGEIAMALAVVLQALRTCFYAVGGYHRLGDFITTNVIDGRSIVPLYEDIPMSGKATVLCPALWNTRLSVEPITVRMSRVDLLNEHMVCVQFSDDFECECECEDGEDCECDGRGDNEVYVVNSPAFISYHK